MKLTIAKLKQIIKEELDAMGEVYRAKGESDEEYAKRKAAAAQSGAKELGTQTSSRAFDPMQFRVRLVIKALKANPRDTFTIRQDVYNYIEDLGTVDMTRLSVRED